MRAFSAALIAALALAVPAQANPREQELARTLEGRVAGEPVQCLRLSSLGSSQIVTDTAIIYSVGNTLYVNRPRGGASQLDKWDVLVTKTFAGQLCSSDIVELRDSSMGSLTGMVSLGEFVPYRKLASARRD